MRTSIAAYERFRKEIQEFKQECLRERGNYKLVSPKYPAHIALGGWMELEGFNQARLGKTLGVEQATVSYWLNKANAPKPDHRDALFALCSIPQQNWDK